MANEVRKRIGANLIIGISGTSLTEEEKKFIVENEIAGVILFSRNYTDVHQLYDLTTQIQSLHHKYNINKAPLLIAVDMEGGRVQRFKAPFTIWPPVKNLGDINSPSLSFKFAQSIGAELKSVGINFNLAPCVDITSDIENKAIGDRSISKDPDNVAKNASAIVRGLVKSGLIACSKHFPGHGFVKEDTHKDLPTDNRTLEAIENCELQAFKKTFRARVDFVLLAHVIYSEVDKKWPASLSEKWIKDILQKSGFRKYAITDDLDMGALRKHWSPEEIAIQAFKAGNDILLYCNDPHSPPKAIDALEGAINNGEISLEDLKKRNQRILNLRNERIPDTTPLAFEEVAKIVGHPEHLNLAKSISKKEIPADL